MTLRWQSWTSTRSRSPVAQRSKPLDRRSPSDAALVERLSLSIEGATEILHMLRFRLKSCPVTEAVCVVEDTLTGCFALTNHGGLAFSEEGVGFLWSDVRSPIVSLAPQPYRRSFCGRLGISEIVPQAL